MSDKTAKQITYLLERLQRAEGELWATQLAVRALILQHDDVPGATWAMPFNVSQPVLLYNKTAFRNAGLDPAGAIPRAPWRVWPGWM